MNTFKAQHLRFRETEAGSTYQRISPEKNGWQYLNFEVRKMKADELWYNNTCQDEYVIVVLSGICSIESTSGNWFNLGKRKNVFEGKPYAVYLPGNTEFSIFSETDDLELACAWCRTGGDHYAKLIRPEDIKVEIKDDGNTARQISYIIPPGFDCHRLSVSEIFIPVSTSDTGFEHKNEQGILKDYSAQDTDLEEVCFYKFDNLSGQAIHHVCSLDNKSAEIIPVGGNDLVAICGRFISDISAHDNNVYCLNIIAGRAESFNPFDPAFCKQVISTESK